jgi:hypothetical protein
MFRIISDYQKSQRHAFQISAILAKVFWNSFEGNELYGAISARKAPVAQSRAELNSSYKIETETTKLKQLLWLAGTRQHVVTDSEIKKPGHF